ncbi:MAG: inositol monophosphatase [Hymenobacteraceae bacterium]|nr:inositol monophosphatase [Hymenobacteraceae bacterium]
MLPDLTTLVHEVGALARRAGAFLQQEAPHFDLSRIEYKGHSDLVSYVDRETEQLLVAGLRELLPEAGFLTEEGTTGTADTTATTRWIIDPLDGTTNFLHGLPCYAVSIGLEVAGEVVLGVIYEPNREELFRATRGGGAFCNEAPLRVTAADGLSKSLIATGFPYTHFAGLDAYLRILADFMAQSHGIRRLGSAAVDLAYVAAGRFEGFFEYNLNAWDVAAGVLIVREAGGLVTRFDGEPTGDPIHGRELVAASPAVHRAMVAVIGQHWPTTVAR